MRRPAPWINAVGFSVFVWLGCFSRIYWPCAAVEAASHPPNIIQLLTLSNERVIALTEDKRGLFYSADGGRKWSQPADLPDAYLYSVSADADGDLFLATSAGVLCSRDGGANWTQAADLKAAFIAFSPDDSSALFKMWGKGLFRTLPGYFTEAKLADNAQVAQEQAELETKLKESWTELTRLKELPDSSAEKPQLLPQYRQWQSLQEQSEKLRKSARAQLAKAVGLPQTPVQTLTFRNRSEVFAGFFGQGVYRSRDGGKTWQEAKSGLPNRYVLTIGTSPEGSLFAGTYGGGLLRFSDQSQSWSLVNTGLTDGIVQCMAFSPAGLMIIGTRGEGVLTSPDEGKTWNRSGGALTNANIQSLSAGPEGLLYAGAYESGLFVSRDAGQTWVPRPFAYLSYVKQVVTDGNGAWYVDVRGLGLLKSSGKGQGWTLVSLPFAYDTTLSVAVGRENFLVAGALESPVHVSRDGGLTWRKLMAGFAGKGVNALRADPAGEIYAASSDGNGLYRLAHGSGWEKIIAADEHGSDYSCWDVVFLPDSEAAAYGYNDILISSEQLNVWHRTRFGQSFTSLWLDLSGRIWTERMLSTFFLAEDGEWKESTDLPNDRYTKFVKLDDDLFAAIRMEGGVDVLRSSGNALELVRRGLGNKRVLALAVDRENAILAGSETGLWVSNDFGESWQEIELQ